MTSERRVRKDDLVASTSSGTQHYSSGRVHEVSCPCPNCPNRRALESPFDSRLADVKVQLEKVGATDCRFFHMVPLFLRPWLRVTKLDCLVVVRLLCLSNP